MNSTTDQVPFGWAGKGYVPNLWVKYKLTLQKFNEYWQLQGGKCSGCKREMAHPLNRELNKFGCRPEIDHDHTTGKVRGLLCRRCNDFLGKIKDNKEHLLALIDYLQRNGDW